MEEKEEVKEEVKEEKLHEEEEDEEEKLLVDSSNVPLPDFIDRNMARIDLLNQGVNVKVKAAAAVRNSSPACSSKVKGTHH